MKFPPIDPPPPEIESLLANERATPPVHDELRMRAVERARAELAYRLRTDSQDSRGFARPRRVTVAVAAAAGVMLATLAAVAFHGVHRSSFEDEGQSANTSAPEPRIPDSQVPAALPDQPSEARPAVTTRTEGWPRGKTVGRARTATRTRSQTYAIELGILRPAHRAVARHDFTSALAAIAEHQHRFASGQLAEEREALRVRALLGLERRAEAQRAASAFRERFPHSALLLRMGSMLDASP